MGDSLSGFRSKPKINPIQENLSIRKSADVGIFDPPNKPQRPIEADYRNGIISDKDGNLLVDMDGDPLTAKYIAGRRTVDGGDVGLTPEEINAIGEEITGKKIEIVPADELDGDAGAFRYYPDTKEPIDIRLADDLTPEDLDRVRGHEVSHAMDLEAGEIPTKGLGIDKELDRNYSTLTTGDENRRKLSLPHLRSYQGDDIRAEKVAEAFRAALTNPNYLKTVAPKTYETLRRWIKDNPELARIVQLNNLAAATAAGLSLLGGAEESKASELPRQRGARTNLNDANSNLGPPPTVELTSNSIKGSSLGLARIAKALELRNLAPTHRAPGKFSPIARALLDLQTKRKTPTFGGPR